MARGVKTGGRKAGTPNKVSGAVKDMVVQALGRVGGVKYLERQASDNPTAFLTLVGKIIPHEVSGIDGNPIKLLVQSEDVGSL